MPVAKHSSGHVHGGTRNFEMAALRKVRAARAASAESAGAAALVKSRPLLQPSPIPKSQPTDAPAPAPAMQRVQLIAIDGINAPIESTICPHIFELAPHTQLPHGPPGLFAFRSTSRPARVHCQQQWA